MADNTGKWLGSRGMMELFVDVLSKAICQRVSSYQGFALTG